MVRIISGYYKGHLLKTNRNSHLRPTSDRVKEALFSILGNIENLRVIDLFAGCGNLGLEAISRGASSCVMVENNIQQVKLIGENVNNLGLEGDVEIIKMDALKYLSEPRDVDIILADPPYKYPFINDFFNVLKERYSGIRVALEFGKDLHLPELILPYVESHRVIGEASLTILRI